MPRKERLQRKKRKHNKRLLSRFYSREELVIAKVNS
jgi:hypothetical protein